MKDFSYDNDDLFLLDDNELKNIIYKDILSFSEIDEYKKLAKARFIDLDKYNKIRNKIINELEKNDINEENINGITFIYSNEVERYFADKISLIDSDLNRFIDKKIKVICNKDIDSNESNYYINNNLIIINIGLLGDINKFSNKSIFVSDKPNLRNSFIMYSLISTLELVDRDDPFYDNLNKLSDLKDIVLLLLDKYEDDIAMELASDYVEEDKLFKDDLINYTFDFFKKVDKSGRIVKILNEILDNGNLSLREGKKAKNKDNISKASSLEDAYVDPITEEIVIHSSGTITDFIVLCHELMHYNSFKDNYSNSSYEVSFFSEFPSIYFESLAKKYAESNNMKTNFSVARNALSINSLYSNLFIIDLIELYFNNNLNNNTINKLIDKYNINQDTIISLFKDDVLSKVTTELSYIVGILFTKYCIDNNISSDIIIDISNNLYSYSFKEVLDKLNMNDYVLDGNKEKTTSIGR